MTQSVQHKQKKMKKEKKGKERKGKNFLKKDYENRKTLEN